MPLSLPQTRVPQTEEDTGEAAAQLLTREESSIQVFILIKRIRVGDGTLIGVIFQVSTWKIIFLKGACFLMEKLNELTVGWQFRPEKSNSLGINMTSVCS